MTMQGNVDIVTADMIIGWAHDPKSPAPVQVEVVYGGATIGGGIADLPRPDVAKAIKTNGRQGFHISDDRIKSLDKAALGKIVVRAQNREGCWINLHGVEQATGQASTQVGSYQSFDGVEGSSKSSEKLNALRLHELPNRTSEETPLKGLSVLDLGCNEGFFCGEAQRQGAKRVVGIDGDQGFIGKAKQRFPAVEFIHGSWWNLPNEQFDVIFFLSALHYEPRQKALLDKIAAHLTPTGTLVIECGIAPNAHSDERMWYAIKRWDGMMRYPTVNYFMSDILDAYSTRAIGPSVAQQGDPISRAVFHCTRRTPTVLLVAGASRSGKTALCRGFAASGVVIFKTDHLLARMIREERYSWTPLASKLQQFRVPGELRLDLAGQFIVTNDLVDEFVAALLTEAPLDARTLCIEGEILRHKPVLDAATKALSAAGVKCWTLTP